MISNLLKKDSANFLLLDQNVSGEISLNLENSIKEMSIEEEIALLKQWLCPHDTLYTWLAAKKLDGMDKNWENIYTKYVNDNHISLFLSEWEDLMHNAPHLYNCLWKMKYRIDVWTWNWNVSYFIAMIMSTSIRNAMTNSCDFGVGFPDDFYMGPKKHFVSCDLSNSSLQIAKKNSEKKHFELRRIYKPYYFDWNFLDCLSNSEQEAYPRLITMFNVLSNFSEKWLKDILKKLHKKMRSKDVLIASFFDIEWLKNSEISQSLYTNEESQDWCLTWFSEKYDVSKDQLKFSSITKEESRFYFDNWVQVCPDTILTIRRNKKTKHIKAKYLVQDSNWLVRFSLFKSYREHKTYIEKLCKEIGFKVEYVFYDYSKMLFAPVLYKE